MWSFIIVLSILATIVFIFIGIKSAFRRTGKFRSKSRRFKKFLMLAGISFGVMIFAIISDQTQPKPLVVKFSNAPSITTNDSKDAENQAISDARKGIVVSLGDSISVQPEGKDFIVWLQSMTGLNIIRKGVPGVGTQYILNNFTSLVSSLDPQPEMAILEIGTNDFGGTENVDNTKERYKEIVSKLVKLGIKPLLVNVLPRDDIDTKTKTAQFNEWLLEYGHQNGFPVADAYSRFANSDGSAKSGFLYDTIHPSPIGAYNIAEAIANVIPYKRKADISNGSNKVLNPLFNVDTNADGVADNWNLSAEASVKSTGTLSAHPTEGNWQVINRSGGSSSGSVTLIDQTVNGFAAGDKIIVGLDVDTGVLPTGVIVSCVYYVQGDAGNIGGSRIVIPPSNLQLNNMRFEATETLPVGAKRILIHCLVYGNGTAAVKFGRVMVGEIEDL